jgi:hypothetical protein
MNMTIMPFAGDKLSWLLKLPVVLIWMDQDQKVLRWQLSCVSDVVLMLQRGIQSYSDEKKEGE